MVCASPSRAAISSIDSSNLGVFPIMEEEPTTEPHELTLDEAVSLAIVLQNNERVADAEQLYRRVLELAPEHPHALHYSGVLAHQQGRSEEALALVGRSLALEPDRADWHSN